MRKLCALAITLLLAGCSGVNIPNPFSSTVSGETYLSMFPDVPVPADFHTVPKSSMVNTTPSNVKVGLETFEGNISPGGVANIMLTGMPKQGWNLIGAVNGRRIMQIYQKEQRFAVLVFFDQTISTAMEAWVVNHGESAYSSMPMGGNAQPASSVPTIPSPSAPASSSDVSSQTLSQ